MRLGPFVHFFGFVENVLSLLKELNLPMSVVESHISISEAQKLLKQASHYHSNNLETTLFDVGARGHFENPTTDLLAFFFDPAGDHGLGSVCLEALISIVSPETPLSQQKPVEPPIREAVTENGKKIDLILHAEDWVLILENKIFHHLQNPFKDYETYIKEETDYRDKNKFFVVLSPDAKAPKEWIGISYQQLTRAIKSRLGEYIVSQPLNKWPVLLREFLVHLEQLTMNELSEEACDFVFDNFCQIRKVTDLRKDAVNQLQKELRNFLQVKFDDEVQTLCHHWHGGAPAIRYSLASWTSESDVVVFLDDREAALKACILVYACNLDERLGEKADKHFRAENDVIKHWPENHGTIGAYETPVKDFEVEKLKGILFNKMKLLDEFEKTIRPKTALT